METTQITPVTRQSTGSAIQQADIALSARASELAKIVYHVNQLVPYPLSDIQIEDWAKSIDEEIPNLEFDALKFLIRKMKVGEYEWDYKKGIQNIFRGLRFVVKDADGYFLRDPQTTTVSSPYSYHKNPRI